MPLLGRRDLWLDNDTHKYQQLVGGNRCVTCVRSSALFARWDQGIVAHSAPWKYCLAQEKAGSVAQGQMG